MAPYGLHPPALREYCSADSYSDDSFKGGPGAGNKSRETFDNKIPMPKDNVTLSDEGARRVKKRRLTLRKLLMMHKPKPAAVKNFFSSAWSCSNGNGPAKLNGKPF